MPDRLHPTVVCRIEDALRDEDTMHTHEYFQELAITYKCHISTIYRHYKRISRILLVERRTGGQHRVITFRVEVAIRHLLDIRPWYYQDEICDFLLDTFDISITQQAVSKALARIKYTRKRLKVIAAQRDDELRVDWLDQL